MRRQRGWPTPTRCPRGSRDTRASMARFSSHGDWMTALEYTLIGLPVVFAIYAYLGYPVLLRLVSLLRPAKPRPADPEQWPSISISVPAYNEAAVYRRDSRSHPRDRLPGRAPPGAGGQSDASTDRTDKMVLGYRGRGVELLRMPQRTGKTGAENAAQPPAARRYRDQHRRLGPASSRITEAPGRGLQRPDGRGGLGRRRERGQRRRLRPTSGRRVRGVRRLRDVAAAAGDAPVRGDRRRLGQGLRRPRRTPSHARARGAQPGLRRGADRARGGAARRLRGPGGLLRAARAGPCTSEYRRKVRTMARGLETLWYKKHLLNPLRYGVFAWMLWSHKLLRWLMALTWAAGARGAGGAHRRGPRERRGPGHSSAFGVLVVGAGLAGWLLPEDRGRLPRVLAMPGLRGVEDFLVAGLHAWIKALSGELNPLWEPTRRAPGPSARQGGGVERGDQGRGARRASPAAARRPRCLGRRG